MRYSGGISTTSLGPSPAVYLERRPDFDCLDTALSFAMADVWCNGCAESIKDGEAYLWANGGTRMCLACWPHYVTFSLDRCAYRYGKRQLKQIRKMLRTNRHTPSANLP
jgi:hypothetical protein